MTPHQLIALADEACQDAKMALDTIRRLEAATAAYWPRPLTDNGIPPPQAARMARKQIELTIDALDMVVLAGFLNGVKTFTRNERRPRKQAETQQ